MIDAAQPLGETAGVHRFRLELLLLFVLFSDGFARAQSSRDTVIEVSALVQESPAQITLAWPGTSDPVTLQKLFRKVKGAPVWTDIATLPNAATGYIDSAVMVGVSYEYFVLRIFRTTDPGSASGYLNAGIRLPLAPARGRAILLVDDTMAAGLATELTRFAGDLVGDGWTVVRQDVPRTATAAATKAVVQTLFNADPEKTRSLILIGHVPVPYSGNLYPDGHPDHRGAWPADVYYGDMNGTWTDSSVDDAGASRAENRNIPGDGKFDQSGVPGDVKLGVGRIDLASMPSASAGLSELDLLRQYLDRNHAFRHKTGPYSNVVRRGLISDNFGYFNGEAFAASGWRNFTSFFGSAPGAVVPQAWLSGLENDSYLWAYGCGGGSYTSAAGVGSTSDFATTRSLSVFNMLFGSYFGDWDVTDSFLRAPLAGRADSLGLVSIWAGRPHWHLYDMALGGTVGDGARTTQNNAGFSTGGYTMNFGGRGVHIALMGDPTLRLHPVLPVTDFVVNSTSGTPLLTWTPSADSNIEGYSVLRLDTAEGPFESIGGSLVTGASFVDRTGTPGQTYSYQVRAVKLETSAGGTYLNNSQGVFGSGAFTGPVSREIQVTGNGRAIPGGSTLAEVANGSDFGSAEANLQTVTRTFTIANSGTDPLSLTGTPVVRIGGPGAGDFSVVAQPADSIAGSGSITFQIVFAPTVVGASTATVSIASNDPDETPYPFVIAGTGLAPSPEIDLVPAFIARTLAPDASATSPVTIVNTGAGALHHTIGTSQTGYTFRDSNSFGGPGYAWIEIGATGTEVTGFSNPDDAVSGMIPIGFSFPFFGTNFTSLSVGTNGFIAFGGATPFYYGTGLPSIEAPGNIIAAFANDLILDESSHIYIQTIGDLFVIQFENIPRFGFPAARVTCEIVLRQTGEITLQYKQVPPSFTEYAVGIQDGLRTQGLQVAFNAGYAQAQMAVRIVPPGFYSWLGSGVSAGTVLPGGSQGLDATLDSTGLSPGYYLALLNVNSNDPDEARLSVPVELTVPGPQANVLGNGLIIASGDMTPETVDSTDFGMAAITGGPVARTFTIRNPGADPLTLSATAVSGGGFSMTTPPDATVAPLGSTTFVVTFAPTAAGAATGTVSLTTNDADQGSYTFAVSGLGLGPVESWRLAHFGVIANAGDAANTADPDGDAYNNLMEYAFGTNPTDSASGPGSITFAAESIILRGQPTVSVTHTATDVDGRAVFGRRKDHLTAGLIYTLQFSADLDTWENSVATPTVVASDTEIDAVTVRFPRLLGTGKKPRFFRLQVTFQ